MEYKIIKYGYRNTEESIIELVVEDSCGNKFQGLLKLEKELTNKEKKC